jgi:hypothetical protein
MITRWRFPTASLTRQESGAQPVAGFHFFGDVESALSGDMSAFSGDPSSAA